MPPRALRESKIFDKKICEIMTSAYMVLADLQTGQCRKGQSFCDRFSPVAPDGFRFPGLVSDLVLALPISVDSLG